MKRVSKSKTVAFASIALLGSVFASSLVHAGDSASTAKIGAAAPGFSLTDQNGKTVKLSDFAGKVVVLEWTNPECPFVQRHYQAKTMTTLEKDFSPKNVVWIGINSSQDASTAADLAWAKAQGINWPLLSDSTGATGHAYNAKTTPEMYVINQSGKLVYSGGIDDDPSGEKTDKVNYVNKALSEVLAGKAVTTPVTPSYGCHVHYAD